jgi:hypothetical protein
MFSHLLYQGLRKLASELQSKPDMPDEETTGPRSYQSPIKDIRHCNNIENDSTTKIKISKNTNIKGFTMKPTSTGIPIT